MSTDADAVMLLRVLREWYWTNGAERRDDGARAHPLYPGNRRDPDGYGSRRALWAAVDALIASEVSI